MIYIIYNYRRDILSFTMHSTNFILAYEQLKFTEVNKKERDLKTGDALIESCCFKINVLLAIWGIHNSFDYLQFCYKQRTILRLSYCICVSVKTVISRTTVNTT